MGNEFLIVKGRKYCVKIRNSSLCLEDFGIEGITDISEDIEGLENLHGLRELIFGGYNRITEINGLEYLTDLELLDISGNQITEIKGLANLSKLKTLYLEYNEIQEIMGLDDLINLKNLSLNSNEYSQVHSWERFHES